MNIYKILHTICFAKLIPKHRLRFKKINTLLCFRIIQDVKELLDGCEDPQPRSFTLDLPVLSEESVKEGVQTNNGQIRSSSPAASL
jgi:hypothetical protein